MKPSDAFACIAHRKTERVEIDRSRADHDHAADAVSAGHPAPDPGRALQQEDRRLPALHARLQHGLSRLRHRRARPDVDHRAAGRGHRQRGRYFVDCVQAPRGPERGRPSLSEAAVREGGALSAPWRFASGDPPIAWLKPRVDVGDLGGDAGGQVGEQERGDVADVVDRHVAAQRRVVLDDVEDLAEALDARSGQRLDRPRRDAVDADAARRPGWSRGSARSPRATPWPGPSCCSSARCARRRDRSG